MSILLHLHRTSEVCFQIYFTDLKTWIRFGAHHVCHFREAKLNGGCDVSMSRYVLVVMTNVNKMPKQQCDFAAQLLEEHELFEKQKNN